PGGGRDQPVTRGGSAGRENATGPDVPIGCVQRASAPVTRAHGGPGIDCGWFAATALREVSTQPHHTEESGTANPANLSIPRKCPGVEKSFGTLFVENRRGGER